MKASIQGRITDPGQQVVPGADITIEGPDSSELRHLVSDENGEYALHGLQPGTYQVEVRMPGFQKFTGEDVTLRLGETLILDIRLEIAGSSDEITVTASRTRRRSSYPSPANTVHVEQIKSMNIATVEDIVNYQPSLTVRRRFIGDPNGTLGMRGANMFQTARSMVYSDGVPLHNPLQTRWNGAPRWSLVAPDEIESAEVIYGPFSAEYGGNAMGGVVKLNTRLPQQREIRVDGSFFSQPFDFHGAEGTFRGWRFFGSYGERIGKFSFQVFHNHLDNSSQPQNFSRYEGSLGQAGDDPQVSGAFRTVTERGAPAILYGDTGPERVRTDLVKFKAGYEFSPRLFTQVTVAYEDRSGERTEPGNYLRDDQGKPIWGDGNDSTHDAVFNGESFNIRNALFGMGQFSRKSLILGWELHRSLANNWNFQSTVSRFSILKDEDTQSNFNPRDPLDDGSGIITAFNDSGWTTLDLRLENPSLFDNLNLSFLTGYHFSTQQIRVDQFSSANFRAGTRDGFQNASGGETSIHALFAQLSWRMHPDWELTLGGRHEFWKSREGFFETSQLSLKQPERDISKFSPKFSLGWEPADRLRLQYSLALAHRFPVPEELFDFEFRTFGTVLGDATLDPEIGTHHNLTFQCGMADGHLELNVFRDDVANTIFTQSQILEGSPIFSFLPIDEVATTGLELVLVQPRILGSRLDLRVNTTYLDSTIQKHSLDRSVEGNDFPRMPSFRLGLLGIYHLNSHWEISLGMRYSSDQFDRLDNEDTVGNVFGAIDGYHFVDSKLSYRLESGGRLSFGINNLTNEKAFVFHPWPQRTFFVELSADLLTVFSR